MTTGFEPVDFLTVGHLTEDRTPDGLVLGGTVTYAGLTAHAFGKKVGILTSASAETDLHALTKLQVHNVASEVTSTFQNVYEPDGRRQILFSRAADLERAALPAEWAAAKILHCGPVADEVDQAFCQVRSNQMLCLTPQGWLRSWDDAGEISLRSWETIQDRLTKKAVVVLSSEDIGGALEDAGDIAGECDILAITLGAEGALIYYDDEVRHCAAPSVHEADPTGCGDIFAASFFIGLEMGRDPWEAAALANELAAISATRKGLDSIPRPDEIITVLAARSR
jgi:sugar/nucleoside kinase (ribokinase family)